MPQQHRMRRVGPGAHGRLTLDGRRYAIFLRLLLPPSEAGLLAVRSKRVDAIVLGVLAIGLTVFALWVPAPN